ncbi:MAG: ATP synthase F1 subunit delta [Acidimicrobiia bacterium]
MDEARNPSETADAYASALLRIASSEEDPNAASDEMYKAAMGLSDHADLIDTFTDVRIPDDRKRGILDDLLGAKASRTTVAAMNFVVAAGHARQLGQIAGRLAELSAEAEGEVLAEVRVPSELSPEQTERLKAALEQVTGKRIDVRVTIDSAVIGGVVAKVGDTVLDGSVQHRFTELREQWG